MAKKKEGLFGRRQAIRNEIKDILRGRTPCKNMVFADVSSPLWDEEDLPAIIIYPEGETVEPLNHTEYKRTLRLVVQITSNGAEDPTSKLRTVSDSLDKIGDAVERELDLADARGCNNFDELILTSIEFDYQDEGRKVIGSQRLTYSAMYYTDRPRDSETLADKNFEGFEVDWKLGHDGDETPGEDVDAKDSVDVEIE